MEITQDLLETINSMRFPDDLKQDLCVYLLERDEPLPEFANRWQLREYISVSLLHRRQNDDRKEMNRRRLLDENAEQVVQNLSLGRAENDPVEILSGQEDILIKLDSLSPLLRDTMIQHYVEGRSPEDIASIGNENVEAVRKRITRARNTLKGD